MGQRQEALATLLSCYEIRLAVLGKVHPDVASTLFNMAIEMTALGKKEDALEAYHQCIDIRKQVRAARTWLRTARAEAVVGDDFVAHC